MDEKQLRPAKGIYAPIAETKDLPLSIEDRLVLDAILRKDVDHDLKGVSPKFRDRMSGKFESLKREICRFYRKRKRVATKPDELT